MYSEAVGRSALGDVRPRARMRAAVAQRSPRPRPMGVSGGALRPCALKNYKVGATSARPLNDGRIPHLEHMRGVCPVFMHRCEAEGLHVTTWTFTQTQPSAVQVASERHVSGARAAPERR